jgi:hypothetical protein
VGGRVICAGDGSESCGDRPVVQVMFAGEPVMELCHWHTCELAELGVEPDYSLEPVREAER